MKKYAALFKTEDGKSLDDVDGCLYVVAGDSVGVSNKLQMAWTYVSANDRRVYVTIATRVAPEMSFQCDAGRPDVVVVLKSVFSTEAAALASIAETHMQKALEFTRMSANSTARTGGAA